MRIRVQPTGSKIHRVWKCPPSIVLPQIDTDEVSPAADRGRMIHSYLERVRELGTEAAILWATAGMEEDDAKSAAWLLRAITVEDLPTHLATEVAFLYDWKARTAREIGRGIGRDYAGHLRRTLQRPIGPTEIPLTIDLAGVAEVDGQKIGYAGDYKSGHSKYPAPDRFGQTLLAGLCMHLVYGCDRVVLELLYVRTSGESGIARRTVDDWDLMTFGDEIEAAMELVDYAEAEYVAGRGVPVREGSHCEYCPAFKQCPAKVALIRSMPRELVRLGVTAAVIHGEAPEPGTIVAGGAMSSELAADVWTTIERIEEVFARIKEEICGMAAREEVPLPDGRVIGPLLIEREGLDGPKARDVLVAMFGAAAETYGVELEKEAVTIEVSKASATRAISKLVKAEAEAKGEKPRVLQSKKGDGVVDRFIAEVRRRGGVETSSSHSVKPHVPRKRLKR